MATEVIISNDVTVTKSLELNRASSSKEIAKAGAINHPIAAQILDDGVARRIADDRDMVIRRPERWIGGAAGHVLFVIVAEHVHGHDELPLAVLPVDSSGPFFGHN